MKDRSWPDGERPVPAWLQSEMDDVFAGATILLVEDDADIRELLVTLLTLAGFTPTACGTAEQALQQLREQAFDLVLTDYALPNRTGGWLLRQASEEGLLEATPAMVVTAHPSPADINGFEVIQKPFDLDQLVERVRQRLESGNPMRPRPRPGQGLPSGKSQNGQDGRGEPIELILYVSAHSARSATAIKNIRRALEACKGKVTLTICDLSKDPGGGEQDSVAFTPTLVKRSPGPRTFILGHITSPELLLELLDGCEPD
jgi:CheY-like chemotaxis protein